MPPQQGAQLHRRQTKKEPRRSAAIPTSVDALLAELPRLKSALRAGLDPNMLVEDTARFQGTTWILPGCVQPEVPLLVYACFMGASSPVIDLLLRSGARVDARTDCGLPAPLAALCARPSLQEQLAVLQVPGRGRGRGRQSADCVGAVVLAARQWASRAAAKVSALTLRAAGRWPKLAPTCSCGVPSAAQVLASHGCRTFNCWVLSGAHPSHRVHVTAKVLQLPDWSPQRKVEAIGAWGMAGRGALGLAACCCRYPCPPQPTRHTPAIASGAGGCSTGWRRAGFWPS